MADTMQRMVLRAVAWLGLLVSLSCAKKTSNGQHSITIERATKSNIEEDLKAFGSALKKEQPDDVPIEVVFETDDPAFDTKLGAGSDACGTLKGSNVSYQAQSIGFKENSRICIFLGPRPSGALIFQPRGYPSVEVAYSD